MAEVVPEQKVEVAEMGLVVVWRETEDATVGEHVQHVPALRIASVWGADECLENLVLPVWLGSACLEDGGDASLVVPRSSLRLYQSRFALALRLLRCEGVVLAERLGSVCGGGASARGDWLQSVDVLVDRLVMAVAVLRRCDFLVIGPFQEVLGQCHGRAFHALHRVHCHHA